MAGTLGAEENAEAGQSQLVAGENCRQKAAVIASGEGVLLRGAVLEVNGTSYEYEELTAAAGVNARAILAEDVDATSAAADAEVYLAGKYRTSDLVWPAGIADAQKNAAILALQDRGIILDSDFI